MFLQGYRRLRVAAGRMAWKGNSVFFKNTLVTLWVTPKWESLHTGLVLDERKSWSGIDVSTSERLGHSSGGMFVLLGRSNVSQLRSWGWKPVQFGKGTDVLEDHKLNMSQQSQAT